MLEIKVGPYPSIKNEYDKIADTAKMLDCKRKPTINKLTLKISKISNFSAKPRIIMALKSSTLFQFEAELDTHNRACSRLFSMKRDNICFSIL